MYDFFFSILLYKVYCSARHVGTFSISSVWHQDCEYCKYRLILYTKRTMEFKSPLVKMHSMHLHFQVNAL